MNANTGDRKLDSLIGDLARINSEAARLRAGRRYVDMTDDEKAAYNREVFALSAPRQEREHEGRVS